MPPVLIHVIDSLGLGGAERLLCTTLNALPQFRHIVCYLHEPDTLVGELHATAIYCLGFHRNADIVNCSIRLRKIIRREQPMLVHTHLVRSTWIGRLACARLCPLVFTIHNKLSLDAFNINRWSLWMERLTYTKRQSVICVSEAVLADYRERVGIRGVSAVLYNPVAPLFFQASASQKAGGSTIRLVAVGNLRHQKNYSHLLIALSLLPDVPVTLDVYGGGDQTQLQCLIDHMKLPVTLKGATPVNPELLQQYDAFVQASWFEGYGISVVEAMASRIPLILSDIDVFWEVSGGKALFFDPYIPASIATAIRKFVALNGSDVQHMCDEAYERAVQIARVEGFSQSLSAFYHQVSLQRCVGLPGS